jgi:hypothetical protein
MRYKITFDNERQYNRYREIFIFLLLAWLLMIYWDIDYYDRSYFMFFSLLWTIGFGVIPLLLFENHERQYKVYKIVLYISTITICLYGGLLALWERESIYFNILVYFTIAWGMGFSKLILRWLPD